MVIYVGMIAILNLSLGYALALYMGAGRGPLARAAAGESMESLDYSDSDVDE
jgi:hypothetical protein